jgi:Sugar transferases involved in lipopolysaccharide synthesis
MKRLFDIIVSVLGLVMASLVIVPVIFLVWAQDRCSPFYIASRVGRGEKLFRMVKLRSMVINADKSGVDSTSNKDNRITLVGHFIRRFKLDEITQLWNVLKGDMSFVGPRPNVKRETDLYTKDEKLLLSVTPGITDFSSIFFSDEGQILADKDDPDLSYNQLIRPWKSRLGLIYVENQSVWLDIKLIVYTILAIVNRNKALVKISNLLEKMGADKELIRVTRREVELVPTPPPGSTQVVTSRS